MKDDGVEAGYSNPALSSNLKPALTSSDLHSRWRKQAFSQVQGEKVHSGKTESDIPYSSFCPKINQPAPKLEAG
jgi:hypothetical protein